MRVWLHLRLKQSVWLRRPCVHLASFVYPPRQLKQSVWLRRLRVSTPTAKAVGMVASVVCAPRQLRVSTPTAKAVGVIALVVCASRQLCVSTPTAKAIGMVTSSLVLARVRINSRLLQLSAVVLASVGMRVWLGRRLCICTPTASAVGCSACVGSGACARVRINSRLLQLSAVVLASSVVSVFLAVFTQIKSARASRQNLRLN